MMKMILILLVGLIGCVLANVGNSVDLCNNQADGTFYKDFTDCKRYIACVSGRSLHGSCPDQLLFNSTTASCDYSNRVQCSSCPRTGMKTYGLTGSCSKYVRCLSGVAEYLQCPGDLYYDERSDSCNLQSEVDCVEPICTGSGSYVIGSKEDCSVYYQCSRGQEKRIVCPANQYYSEALGECDAKDKVVCTVTPPRTIELDDITITCPARGEFSYPHPSDCGHYFLCMNGVSAMLTCGPVLRYDIVTQNCALPEKAQCITHFK